MAGTKRVTTLELNLTSRTAKTFMADLARQADNTRTEIARMTAQLAEAKKLGSKRLESDTDKSYADRLSVITNLPKEIKKAQDQLNVFNTILQGNVKNINALAEAIDTKANMSLKRMQQAMKEYQDKMKGMGKVEDADKFLAYAAKLNGTMRLLQGHVAEVKRGFQDVAKEARAGLDNVGKSLNQIPNLLNVMRQQLDAMPQALGSMKGISGAVTALFGDKSTVVGGVKAMKRNIMEALKFTPSETAEWNILKGFEEELDKQQTKIKELSRSISAWIGAASEQDKMRIKQIVDAYNEIDKGNNVSANNSKIFNLTQQLEEGGRIAITKFREIREEMKRLSTIDSMGITKEQQMAIRDVLAGVTKDMKDFADIYAKVMSGQLTGKDAPVALQAIVSQVQVLRKNVGETQEAFDARMKTFRSQVADVVQQLRLVGMTTDQAREAVAALQEKRIHLVDEKERTIADQLINDLNQFIKQNEGKAQDNVARNIISRVFGTEEQMQRTKQAAEALGKAEADAAIKTTQAERELLDLEAKRNAEKEKLKTYNQTLGTATTNLTTAQKENEEAQRQLELLKQQKAEHEALEQKRHKLYSSQTQAENKQNDFARQATELNQKIIAQKAKIAELEGKIAAEEQKQVQTGNELIDIYKYNPLTQAERTRKGELSNQIDTEKAKLKEYEATLKAFQETGGKPVEIKFPKNWETIKSQVNELKAKVNSIWDLDSGARNAFSRMVDRMMSGYEKAFDSAEYYTNEKFAQAVETAVKKDVASLKTTITSLMKNTYVENDPNSPAGMFGRTYINDWKKGQTQAKNIVKRATEMAANSMDVLGTIGGPDSDRRTIQQLSNEVKLYGSEMQSMVTSSKTQLKGLEDEFTVLKTKEEEATRALEKFKNDTVEGISKTGKGVATPVIPEQDRGIYWEEHQKRRADSMVEAGKVFEQANKMIEQSATNATAGISKEQQAILELGWKLRDAGQIYTQQYMSQKKIGDAQDQHKIFKGFADSMKAELKAAAEGASPTFKQQAEEVMRAFEETIKINSPKMAHQMKSGIMAGFTQEEMTSHMKGVLASALKTIVTSADLDRLSSFTGIYEKHSAEMQKLTECTQALQAIRGKERIYFQQEKADTSALTAELQSEQKTLEQLNKQHVEAITKAATWGATAKALKAAFKEATDAMQQDTVSTEKLKEAQTNATAAADKLRKAERELNTLKAGKPEAMTDAEYQRQLTAAQNLKKEAEQTVNLARQKVEQEEKALAATEAARKASIAKNGIDQASLRRFNDDDLALIRQRTAEQLKQATLQKTVLEMTQEERAQYDFLRQSYVSLTAEELRRKKGLEEEDRLAAQQMQRLEMLARLQAAYVEGVGMIPPHFKLANEALKEQIAFWEKDAAAIRMVEGESENYNQSIMRANALKMQLRSQQIAEADSLMSGEISKKSEETIQRAVTLYKEVQHSAELDYETRKRITEQIAKGNAELERSKQLQTAADAYARRTSVSNFTTNDLDLLKQTEQSWDKIVQQERLAGKEVSEHANYLDSLREKNMELSEEWRKMVMDNPFSYSTQQVQQAIGMTEQLIRTKKAQNLTYDDEMNAITRVRQQQEALTNQQKSNDAITKMSADYKILADAVAQRIAAEERLRGAVAQLTQAENELRAVESGAHSAEMRETEEEIAALDKKWEEYQQYLGILERMDEYRQRTNLGPLMDNFQNTNLGTPESHAAWDKFEEEAKKHPEYMALVEERDKHNYSGKATSYFESDAERYTQLEEKLKSLSTSEDELRGKVEAARTAVDNERGALEKLPPVSRKNLEAQEKFWQSEIDKAQAAGQSTDTFRAKLAEVQQLQKTNAMSNLGLTANGTSFDVGTTGMLAQLNDQSFPKTIEWLNKLKQEVEAFKTKFAESPEAVKLLEQELAKADQLQKQLTGDVYSYKETMNLAEKVSKGDYAATAQEIDKMTRSFKYWEKQLQNSSSKKAAKHTEDLRQAHSRMGTVLNTEAMSQERLNQILANPKSVKNLNEMQQAIQIVQNRIRNNTELMSKYGSQLRNLDRAFKEANKQIGYHASTLEQAFSRLKSYVMIYMGFNAMMMKMRQAISGNMELSDTMANVAKVTNATNQEIEVMTRNIQRFETRTATSELMKMAEQAGKLGLYTRGGTKAVEEFVRVADKITSTLGEDVGGAEAVGDLVKLNDLIVGQTGDLSTNLEKLGSAILSVGNNSAASYEGVVSFLRQTGATGSVAGLTAQQLTALGATYSSLGAKIDQSATSTNKVLVGLQKNAETVARAIGMSAIELRKMVDSGDTFGALQAVIDRIHQLSNAGQNEATVIGDVLKAIGGRQNAQMFTAMSLLVENTSRLREELSYASDAYAKGTLMADEYARMQNTLAGQAAKVGKVIKDTFVNPDVQNALASIMSVIGFIVKQMMSLPTVVALATVAVWKFGASIKATNADLIKSGTNMQRTIFMFKQLGVAALGPLKALLRVPKALMSSVISLKDFGKAGVHVGEEIMWSFGRVGSAITGIGTALKNAGKAFGAILKSIGPMMILSGVAWGVTKAIEAFNSVDFGNKLGKSWSDATLEANRNIKKMEKSMDELKSANENVNNSTKDLNKELKKLGTTEEELNKKWVEAHDKGEQLSDTEEKLVRDSRQLAENRQKYAEELMKFNNQYSGYLGYLVTDLNNTALVAAAHDQLAAALRKEADARAYAANMEAIGNEYNEEIAKQKQDLYTDVIDMSGKGWNTKRWKDDLEVTLEDIHAEIVQTIDDVIAKHADDNMSEEAVALESKRAVNEAMKKYLKSGYVWSEEESNSKNTKEYVEVALAKTRKEHAQDRKLASRNKENDRDEELADVKAVYARIYGSENRHGYLNYDEGEFEAFTDAERDNIVSQMDKDRLFLVEVGEKQQAALDKLEELRKERDKNLEGYNTVQYSFIKDVYRNIIEDIDEDIEKQEELVKSYDKRFGDIKDLMDQIAKKYADLSSQQKQILIESVWGKNADTLDKMGAEQLKNVHKKLNEANKAIKDNTDLTEIINMLTKGEGENSPFYKIADQITAAAAAAQKANGDVADAVRKVIDIVDESVVKSADKQHVNLNGDLSHPNHHDKNKWKQEAKDQYNAYIKELDDYYVRQQMSIDKARAKGEMKLAEYNKRTEALEREHENNRSKLRNQYVKGYRDDVLYDTGIGDLDKDTIKKIYGKGDEKFDVEKWLLGDNKDGKGGFAKNRKLIQKLGDALVDEIKLKSDEDQLKILQTWRKHQDEFEKAVINGNPLAKVKDDFQNKLNDLKLIFGKFDFEQALLGNVEHTDEEYEHRMTLLEGFAARITTMTEEEFTAQLKMTEEFKTLEEDEMKLLYQNLLQYRDDYDEAARKQAKQSLKLLTNRVESGEYYEQQLASLKKYQQLLIDTDKTGTEAYLSVARAIDIVSKKQNMLVDGKQTTYQQRQKSALEKAERGVKMEEAVGKTGVGNGVQQGAAKLNVATIKFRQAMELYQIRQSEADRVLNEALDRVDEAYAKMNMFEKGTAEYDAALAEFESKRMELNAAEVQSTEMVADTYDKMLEAQQAVAEQEAEIQAERINNLKDFQNAFKDSIQKFSMATIEAQDAKAFELAELRAKKALGLLQDTTRQRYLIIKKSGEYEEKWMNQEEAIIEQQRIDARNQRIEAFHDMMKNLSERLSKTFTDAIQRQYELKQERKKEEERQKMILDVQKSALGMQMSAEQAMTTFFKSELDERLAYYKHIYEQMNALTPAIFTKGDGTVGKTTTNRANQTNAGAGSTTNNTTNTTSNTTTNNSTTNVTNVYNESTSAIRPVEKMDDGSYWLTLTKSVKEAFVALAADKKANEETSQAFIDMASSLQITTEELSALLVARREDIINNLNKNTSHQTKVAFVNAMEEVVVDSLKPQGGTPVAATQEMELVVKAHDFGKMLTDAFGQVNLESIFFDAFSTATDGFKDPEAWKAVGIATGMQMANAFASAGIQKFSEALMGVVTRKAEKRQAASNAYTEITGNKMSVEQLMSRKTHRIQSQQLDMMRKRANDNLDAYRMAEKQVMAENPNGGDAVKKASDAVAQAEVAKFFADAYERNFKEMRDAFEKKLKDKAVDVADFDKEVTAAAMNKTAMQTGAKFDGKTTSDGTALFDSKAYEQQYNLNQRATEINMNGGWESALDETKQIENTQLLADEYVAIWQAAYLAKSEAGMQSVQTAIDNDQRLTDDAKLNAKQQITDQQKTNKKMLALENTKQVGMAAIQEVGAQGSMAIGDMVAEASGNAALGQLTAGLAQAGANALLGIVQGTADSAKEGWWMPAIVQPILTAIIGAAMGAATSKVKQAKSQISQATGAGSGKLTTGMLTYATGRYLDDDELKKGRITAGMMTMSGGYQPGQSYDVDGADGKSYKAKYSGNVSDMGTGLVRGTHFGIFSEVKPETVIDGDTTAIIHNKYPFLENAWLQVARTGSLNMQEMLGLDYNSIGRTIDTLSKNGVFSGMPRMSGMRMPTFAAGRYPNGSMDSVEGIESLDGIGDTYGAVATANQADIDSRNRLAAAIEAMVTQGINANITPESVAKRARFEQRNGIKNGVNSRGYAVK